MKMTRLKTTVAKMQGVATVDGQVVAEARVMCKLTETASAQPPLPSSESERDFDEWRFILPRLSIRKPKFSARRNWPVLHCWAGVTIGARTRLMAHVYLEGKLTVGEDNTFYPYCSCGVPPQDKKYKANLETRIGNRNTIREFVTIHRGTKGGGMITSIGDENLLMAYVHVAHDVMIHNHTILANGVTFAGHVVVEDYVNVGGLSAIHQFVRLGHIRLSAATA